MVHKFLWYETFDKTSLDDWDVLISRGPDPRRGSWKHIDRINKVGNWFESDAGDKATVSRKIILTRLIFNKIQKLNTSHLIFTTTLLLHSDLKWKSREVFYNLCQEDFSIHNHVLIKHFKMPLFVTFGRIDNKNVFVREKRKLPFLYDLICLLKKNFWNMIFF